MSDETPTTPAATTPDPKPADPPAKAADGDDEYSKMSAEDLIKANKALRSEIAAKRTDSKAAKEEAKLAKEEAALLRSEKEAAELEKKKKNGEWEAIAKEKEDALTATNQRLIRAELKLFAQKEGILDPTDVNNMSLEGLTMDKAGDIHGAEKAIAKLKADKPHWFKAAQAAEPNTPKPTSGKPEPQAGPTPKASVSDMTKSEFEAKKTSFMKDLKARTT